MAAFRGGTANCGAAEVASARFAYTTFVFVFGEEATGALKNVLSLFRIVKL